MIIANLATYPARKKSLKSVVESILFQVDILNIYLNNYDDIPNFLNDSRINCVLGKDASGDLKDNGKFYFLDKVHQDSYYFTIDDDIIYPPDYSERMIEKLKIINNEAVIGLHGIIFHQDFSDFTKTRTAFHFENELKFNLSVSALGTGTVAFKTDLLKGFVLDFFKSTGMADLWFAAYCKMCGVPLLCISREKEWLVELQQETTLWECAMINNTIQNNIINEYKLCELSPDGMNTYRAILEKQVMFSNQQLMEIKESRAFRFGDLILQSIKKPYRLLTFPIDFVKIFQKKG